MECQQKIVATTIIVSAIVMFFIGVVGIILPPEDYVRTVVGTVFITVGSITYCYGVWMFIVTGYVPTNAVYIDIRE